MDVIVVGSGMAGLTAAAELTRKGHRVIVLDKGRRPGGRMTTRYDGEARFDHGAQHFSARSPVFQRRVAEWVDEGAVGIWYEGRSVTGAERGFEPRHVAIGGMRSLMERLAAPHDVRQSTEIEAISIDSGRVAANVEGGQVRADAVVLTPPLPQTLRLLDAGGIGLSDEERSQLNPIAYEPSLTLMASLDGPSGMPDGHRSLDGPVAWIADNQQKGVSPLPTVTIQSSAAYASEFFDADLHEWADDLARTAQEQLDAQITGLVPHRWRYAQPRRTLDIGALTINSEALLVLAGEAFAGAKVEGAFRSGMAAAEAISARA